MGTRCNPKDVARSGTLRVVAKQPAISNVVASSTTSAASHKDTSEIDSIQMTSSTPARLCPSHGQTAARAGVYGTSSAR